MSVVGFVGVEILGLLFKRARLEGWCGCSLNPKPHVRAVADD
jgi:hypothetical protein